METLGPRTDNAAALPRYFTLGDLVEALHLPSTRYAERNVARWPHIMIARQRLFTADDIRAIAEMHRADAGTIRPAEVASPNIPGRVTRGKRGAA